ncbi:MAG TPA: ATP-binding cassette domain-containing protein [Streptosporangiaceae bacterium]|nr:ATP-binding cassette domain-containing protein [Streptosporangiaceae bacterium]
MTQPALLLRTRRLRAARGVTVATDVELTASAGDVIAVEGPNGSGKTTLLTATAGLLPVRGDRVRPATVGYAPERASALPRMATGRWLVGLARTSGLSRADSARRADEVLQRLGLDAAAQRPLHVLSRGNTQRALVAQALIAEPDLVILDEPAGGLDDDGVTRVAAEISRAADRNAIVLVARHPTAPLPLPAGTTWRFTDGTITALRRDGSAATQVMVVETGDGVIRRVPAADLPGVLRSALDTGLSIRRVEPVLADVPQRTTAPAAGSPAMQRTGAVTRVLHGAAHRARLLAMSQWFAAPALLFFAVLGTIYASDAGPPLQAAAVTAIALVAVMMWLTVQAHRVDGRELARAFAVHVGGRARAHLATDLSLVPYAAVLTAVAVLIPVLTQPQSEQHPRALVLRMIALHLGAALFGAGLGSALALIERMGYRLLVAVAVFLGMIVLPHTPLTPLLRLSSNAVTLVTPVSVQVAWLCVPGLVLMAVAAWTATRLS